jgi:hypothetical protein
MPKNSTLSLDVFLACCAAVRNGTLIHRANKQDKEFHFQNWFSARLDGLNCPYDPPARNTYPDFRLVKIAEGYEIKGLAYPGREATYDSNSQVPTGYHNGRAIYYLFGRYPKDAEDDDYPVIDFVMCHGDFLNADHSYVHKNRSIKGFGSYGDIMIRDRKMYVAPTPFALTSGTTGQQTLILPKGESVDDRLAKVGELARVESEKLVIGYGFDLKKNTIKAELIDNPGAGTRHEFVAYRQKGSQTPPVTLKTPTIDVVGEDEDADTTL